MSQEELKKYYEIYAECWKLFKKYSNPTDTEEFWKGFARECHELNEKFGQKKFASDMILAAYNEIERVWKSNRHKSNGLENEKNDYIFAE